MREQEDAATQLGSLLEVFFSSTLLVAFAEIGDKTQLLSFILAARLRRPGPIIAGILVATSLNHAMAGWFGAWLSAFIPTDWLPWLVGAIFIAFGLWALIPDKYDENNVPPSRWGAFLTTTIAFFIAEMGDKTQLATAALGARFEGSLTAVVVGTTLGMMIANVPAVMVGEKLATKLPLNHMRRIAAALFMLTGLASVFWFR